MIARIILGVILISSALLSTAIAHQGEEPQFKMPCAEVVKLGLDKFVDVYGEKTQDYSTYGQKQAFSYYVDCKRPVNDERARQLPEARRQQVDAVRDGLSEIGNASWSNAYILAGGGTMYSLASVSAYAVREDVIASLISAMQAPKDRRARRRANAAIARTRRALPTLRMPALEHWTEADRPDQVKAYQSNTAKIRKAFSELEPIIRLLPDRAADLVAHRMEDELDASFEE